MLTMLHLTTVTNGSLLHYFFAYVIVSKWFTEYGYMIVDKIMKL